MSDAQPRPVSVLVAALGGEGGGVLTNWIVAALESHGLATQSTSIPGVAQRTGTTTYYIETFPVPVTELGGRRPVFSLYPSVGDIDVMVASEIIEAGRAVQNGFVTPARTTLIASTHRIFAIGERSAMADGRFDSERVLAAASARARRTLLDDYATAARDAGTTLNAVLLGVIAASGALPAPVEAFENAIRASGIAVESNLTGFNLGRDSVTAGDAASLPVEPGKRPSGREAAAIEQRARAEFPAAVCEVAIEGVRRLVDYQGPGYGGLYLDRLSDILEVEETGGGDLTLTREVARLLALWMAYEDVIRVAQIKAAPERYRRVLDEVRAGDDDPVVVTEFFKPGIEEFCSVLPGWLARPILGVSERRGWIDRAYVGMHIKTTTINGFFRVWLLSRLRPWRPRTHRFREEQAAIAGWLGDITRAAGSDLALALEIAECAGLLKGYGETYRRGRGNFRRIREEVIEPALSGALPPARAADAVANARAAALADPAGARLTEVLAAIAASPMSRAAE